MPDPIIHLTNFASATAPHSGPGRTYTITIPTQRWQHGDGRVAVLVPRRADLIAFIRAGDTAREAGKKLSRLDASVGNFHRAYRKHVMVQGTPVAPFDHLAHGELRAIETGGRSRAVESGDTLCCNCSRDAAGAGLCHRVWAAKMLRRAGWVVVLDGEVMA